MAEIGRLIGAALAGGGIAMVYMQFNQKSDPSVEAQMPDDVKVSSCSNCAAFSTRHNLPRALLAMPEHRPAPPPSRVRPMSRLAHAMRIAQYAHTKCGSRPRSCVCVCYLQNSRLKKTLTNAGLYPTPGSRLKTQPSGSMAVFASGQPGAALVKGGGEPL